MPRPRSGSPACADSLRDALEASLAALSLSGSDRQISGRTCPGTEVALNAAKLVPGRSGLQRYGTPQKGLPAQSTRYARLRDLYIIFDAVAPDALPLLHRQRPPVGETIAEVRG